MPEFTREDRNLLVRVGKTLREEIVWEEEQGPGWDMARRDRLLRDERDLAHLRKRLEAQQVPSAVVPLTVREE